MSFTRVTPSVSRASETARSFASWLSMLPWSVTTPPGADLTSIFWAWTTGSLARRDSTACLPPQFITAHPDSMVASAMPESQYERWIFMAFSLLRHRKLQETDPPRRCGRERLSRFGAAAERRFG